MPPPTDDWFLAENLKKAEKAVNAKVDAGQDLSASDLGAYYRLLKQQNVDWASMHAVVDDGEAGRYADQALSAARALAPLLGGSSVLDAGCGPGAITEALRRRLGGPAYGVDLSESAVEFARKTYPSCRFDVVLLDEKTALPRKYDLVHAREFYPFTRTDDLAINRRYLHALMSHLKPGGVLLLAMLAAPKSMARNEAVLSEELEKAGATRMRRTMLAGDKLRWLPLPVARALTRAGRALAGDPQRCFYATRRAS